MEFDVIDATDNAPCLRLPKSNLWKREFSNGDGCVFSNCSNLGINFLFLHSLSRLYFCT